MFTAVLCPSAGSTPANWWRLRRDLARQSHPAQHLLSWKQWLRLPRAGKRHTDETHGYTLFLPAGDRLSPNALEYYAAIIRENNFPPAVMCDADRWNPATRRRGPWLRTAPLTPEMIRLGAAPPPTTIWRNDLWPPGEPDSTAARDRLARQRIAPARAHLPLWHVAAPLATPPLEKIPDPPAGWPTVALIVHDAREPAATTAAAQRLHEETDYPCLDVRIADLDVSSRVPYGRSLPQALNAAVNRTNAEWIFFADAAITSEKSDWLKHLVTAAQSLQAGAAGPLLLYPNLSVENAGLHIGLESLAGPPHRHADPSCDHPAGHPGHIRPVTAISGRALLTPRRTFVRLGGFDENYFRADYDTDYGIRLHQAGEHCYLLPAARLIRQTSCFYEEPYYHGDAVRLTKRIADAGWTSDPWLHPALNLFTHPVRLRLPSEPDPAAVLAAKFSAVRNTRVADAPSAVAPLKSEALPPGDSAADLRIRRVFIWRRDIRRHFPLALTPEGQAPFLRWLREFGQPEYGFTEDEITDFITASASCPSAGLVATWQHMPEWQEQFPHALTPNGWPIFLSWLRDTFGLDPARYRSAPLPPERRAESAPHGVNLLGHLLLPCGLQYSAREALSQLQRQNIPCSARNVPARELDEPPGHGEFVGREEYDITLFFVPPLVSMEFWYARAGLARRPGVYRVGNWYWEFPEIPDSWRVNLDGYHEIWAPTRFIRDAWARCSAVPIRTMLPGVSVESSPRPRADFGLPNDRFIFLFMFDFASIMARKNPIGLIRAFREAFSPSEPVLLVIKCLRHEIYPDDWAILRTAAASAGVKLITDLMSRADTMSLIAACDAYASLHRTEGFGLTMAEAMLLGKPVVATGYSGNLDFMTPENSRLVRYRLGKTGHIPPPYQTGWTWAEPDPTDAAAQLRWVYDYPADADAMAQRGRREAQALLAPEAYGRRLTEALADIRAQRATP